jgi:hypothetical protein
MEKDSNNLVEHHDEEEQAEDPHYQPFPMNLSNALCPKEGDKGRPEMEIVFRNYKPSKGSGLPEQGDAMIHHFKEAGVLEESYDKKAKANIKKYLKNEDDPMSGLVPKQANIDLKRNLGLKLEKLNAKTERAILEILSKIHTHISSITQLL